jgi:hypothetical protein
MRSYPLNYNQFKDGMREGRLLGLKCQDCNSVTVPPNGVCPECGGLNLEVTPTPARGVIKTFTVIRVGPEGYPPPYVVAMVELEEKSWIMGNLEGLDPNTMTMDVIGLPVKVSPRFFTPANPADGGREGLAFIFTPEK